MPRVGELLSLLVWDQVRKLRGSAELLAALSIQRLPMEDFLQRLHRLFGKRFFGRDPANVSS